MVFAVSFSLLQSSLTQSESEEHASPVSSAALDGPKQEFRGCLIPCYQITKSSQDMTQKAFGKHHDVAVRQRWLSQSSMLEAFKSVRIKPDANELRNLKELQQNIQRDHRS